MKLEEIGFYTLSDARALRSTSVSRLERCELLLTRQCNFNCHYCRHVGPGETSLDDARAVVSYWGSKRCRNMRFSGGEPTLWGNLPSLVRFARRQPGCEHVALSTNGSAALATYTSLLEAGVNDFSISLDACCASKAGRMMGGQGDMVTHVMEVIRYLAPQTYVTIGTVLLPTNLPEAQDIVKFALDAGVADVRLISAAQWNKPLNLELPAQALDKFPILRYRAANMAKGRNMRGIEAGGCPTCYLGLDDMVVSGGKHYPCIIYLREGGDPIGSMSGNVRQDRDAWVKRHNSCSDPICQKNCLDVCCDYNDRASTRYVV